MRYSRLVRSVKRQGYYFQLAVGFFTRVPMPSHEDFHTSDLNHAAKYFPLIGILVGSAGALVFYLVDLLLPIALAILLSMAATIMLTGAFHEDGLADAADGLGGGWTREQVLTIMVDSRIGSYGALALILALLTKYQALSHQDATLIPLSLIAGHALSRWCALLVMFKQSYVKFDGKSKPLATELSVADLVVASCFGLFPLVFFDYKYLLALVPVALVWLWFSAKLRLRIGGYTGDCLGAMQQLTEIAFYVGLLASAGWFSNAVQHI